MSAVTARQLTLSHPLDPITTERLALAGVSQAATSTRPGRPLHRHVPADAETLAWNMAREAEWHAAPTVVEALLREIAPAVFSDSPPPLAVGIDAALRDLLEGECEAPVIGRFLRDWVRRPAYLEALARGDVRRDLNGHPAGAPEDRAREFAAILLGRGAAP